MILESGGRKIVKVPVTIDLIIEMMTEGWTTEPYALKCISGLPKGAKFIGATHDPLTCNVFFFFEHESFDLVHYSEIPPRVYPEILSIELKSEADEG